MTHGAPDDRSPAWLSEQHLAFVSDREEDDALWLIDLQTREIRRLTARGGETASHDPPDAASVLGPST